MGRLGAALAAAGPALRHGAQEGRAAVLPLLAALQLPLQELLLQAVEDQPRAAGVLLYY